VYELQVQTLRKLTTSVTVVAIIAKWQLNCEKDVRVRIGKATAVFGKMRKIEDCISLKVKMRLYEGIILSTLLYSADLWHH